MFTLPIPRFKSATDLHKRLFQAAKSAEACAAEVELSAGVHFSKARKQIRQALASAGISKQIDKLVEELLPK